MTPPDQPILRCTPYLTPLQRFFLTLKLLTDRLWAAYSGMSVTAHLSWAPNPSAEMVTSYEVWEATDGQTFLLRGTVQDPDITIPGLPTGQYAWKIRAKNLAGTSEFSDVATGPSVPSKPSTPVVVLTEEP